MKVAGTPETDLNEVSWLSRHQALRGLGAWDRNRIQNLEGLSTPVATPPPGVPC